MASQERTLSALLCHYGFVLLWRILRGVNVSLAWTFFRWGLRNGFMLIDYRPLRGLQTNFWGQKLKTPVGISSEIDTQGVILDALIQMGYGFGDLGTYTLEREDGESKAFYFPKERAIGFAASGYKNQGVVNALKMLCDRRWLPHLTGVSIATTADDEMSNFKQGSVITYTHEFELMTQKIAPYCDYIVANLTMPNTDLSDRIYDETTIVPVLQKIKETTQIAAPLATPKTVVKVPLDLSEIEVPVVANICMKAGVDAIMIGGEMNLTKNRGFLSRVKLPNEPLSLLIGVPNKRPCLALIRRLRKETNGQIPIIAGGGIFTGQDVFDCLAAGASLVQVYAALLIDGPFAFKKIHRELFQIMRKKGFNSVSEVIGSRQEEI